MRNQKFDTVLAKDGNITLITRIKRDGKIGVATVVVYRKESKWKVSKASIHIEDDRAVTDCKYIGKGKHCRCISYPKLLEHCQRVLDVLGQECLQKDLIGFIEIEYR